MRQQIASSSSPKRPISSRPGWRFFSAALAAAIVAQAAIFQAFRQFASEAVAQQASTLTDKRLFSQAQVEAQRAAELYPYNAYALFRIGASNFTAGSSPEHQIRAAESLERARLYMPHKPNVLRLLGQSYYYLKRYDQAAETLDQFFLLNPNPKDGVSHLHLVRALAHFRSGNGQFQGRSIVPITLAGERPDVRSDVAVPHLLNAVQLNHTRSAESLVREWIFRGTDQKLTPTQVQEIFAAAGAAGKFQLLTGILDSATQEGRIESRFSKYLAGAYLKAGQPDKAASLGKRLLSQNPSDPDLFLLLGDVELRRQNITAAREHYRNHLRLQPDSMAREEIVRNVGRLP